MGILRFTRRLTTGAIAAGFLVSIVLPTWAGAADTTAPTLVTIAGSLQSEVGCPGDWQPDCALTRLVYDANGDVWTATFNLSAGNYEYKTALNDSWNENYGAGGVLNGGNVGLSLVASQDVTFLYSHETHWVTDDVNSRIVTAAGSFQSELGCPGDWDPSCLRSWLQNPDGDSTYSFTTDQIPAGTYEAKAAIGRTWDESYPVSNVSFTVAAGQSVTFSFDSATNEFTITTSGASGQDTEEPTWMIPTDVTANATSAAGAVVSYSATAADNVGVVSSSCAPASGSAFPMGATTVNCVASDAAGNVGSESFTITIVAPQVLPPKVAATCRALDRVLGLLRRQLGDGSIKPVYGVQLAKAAEAAKASLGCP